MSAKLKPLGDRLVVEPKEQEALMAQANCLYNEAKTIIK